MFFLQSLIGKLNFVSACVQASRIFICRLLNWLRYSLNTKPVLRRTDLVQIPGEVRKDLLWWKHFLKSYNGVSMMLMDMWSVPDSVISCDASLVGCGDGRFFHAKFPAFIQEMQLSIYSLELLTIVETIKLWSSLLMNQKVVIYCDNMSSVIVVNAGFSKETFQLFINLAVARFVI